MVSKLLLGAAGVLITSVFVSVSVDAGQHAHGPAASAPTKVTPMKAAPPGALPALPRVPFEPVRPMAVVQQVYEFAARHPEVLQYVPCYCGCERVGHNGNHDCFVKARAANGRITEWDAHGLGCTICLDVGRDAMTMFNSGAPVSAIRTAIDKKYASHFPSSTPTPQPARSLSGATK
jgi:hypothetical protein